MVDPLGEIISGLRLTVFYIDLEFTRSAHFHAVSHGPVQYAALMAALGKPPQFPPSLIPHSIESGRPHYRPGDPYRLAFTGLPGLPDPNFLVRRRAILI